jgi:NitT/TauT family transport system substrate-binding protein
VLNLDGQRSGSALLIGCCLALAACSSQASAPSSSVVATAGPASVPPASVNKPAANAGATEASGHSIVIAIPATSVAHLPVFVARDAGIYQRHGLQATITNVQAPLQMPALQKGDIQYTTVVGGIVSGAFNGFDVKVIGISVPAPFFQWVVQPSIQNINDLKGKKLAVTSVGTTDFDSAAAVLRKHGLEPNKDVALVATGGDFGVMAEALKNGAINGAQMSPPWPAKLKGDGFKVLLKLSDELDFPQAGLGTTAARIAQNHEEAEAVVQSELEAIRYIASNREGTLQILEKDFALPADEAAETYDSVATSFRSDMKPSVEGIGNLAKSVLASVPKAQGLSTQQIYDRVVDESLVNEALKST